MFKNKGNIYVKKYIISFIASIFVVIVYMVFFTGIKTQPSELEIGQINEIYHTSFPDTIETTSIGEQVDKALFNKKETVHEVILVTDYYYCEFEMTKGEKTFSSPKSEYLKHEFKMNVDGISIEVGQYDYSTLNTEDTYKPTYILTFDYQDTFFYVTIRSMEDSPFIYEQNETIKLEEFICLEELIRENILCI